MMTSEKFRGQIGSNKSCAARAIEVSKVFLPGAGVFMQKGPEYCASAGSGVGGLRAQM